MYVNYNLKHKTGYHKLYIYIKIKKHINRSSLLFIIIVIIAFFIITIIFWSFVVIAAAEAAAVAATNHLYKGSLSKIIIIPYLNLIIELAILD